jgi:hypothetical protein
MQIQMQAFGRKSTSLRQLITKDLASDNHDMLFVKEGKAKGRNKGWAKISAKGVPGTLNVEWSGGQRALLVRAIAKRGNTPHELLGIFTGYLVGRFGNKIGSINLQLR